MSYLLNYNPGTPQYTYPRRGGAKLSGTCIIHTAECAMDLDGDDQSAETCASFIANRADYGSYHRLVDSDSIIDMVPFEYEAWQDSETNNWAVGISAAVQAGRWLEIPAARRDRVYRNMAAAAAEFVRHMAGKGITVPLRRITGAEARSRVPGFCAHGDSGLYRSDPGVQFDWALFFGYTAQALAGGINFQSSITPIQEDDPLANFSEADIVNLVQQGIDGWAMNSRRFPENRNLLDQLIQTRTDLGAVHELVKVLPANVLYNERVDGRNLFDWLKQLRSDVVGIQPGSIDVAGIAKALAEQLPQADAEALVDALAARLVK